MQRNIDSTSQAAVTPGRVAASAFISLDGVLNHMESWHFEYVDAESGELAMDQLTWADALLMGHATYDVYAAVWPAREGAYAHAINAIPKYVASTTLSKADWHGSTVLDAAELVPTVRRLVADGTNVLLHGYGPVARTLLQHGMLDELHLWVHPVLAGVGDVDDMLFHPGQHHVFELDGTRTLSSGVVVMSFRTPRETVE